MEGSVGALRRESTHPTPVGSCGGPSDSAYIVATSERERWISGSSADAAFTCGPATNSCLCRASAPGLASGACLQQHHFREVLMTSPSKDHW